MAFGQILINLIISWLSWAALWGLAALVVLTCLFLIYRHVRSAS